MVNQEPCSFDIDIQGLQQTSKRPFHLEQRMKSRKMQPKLSIKAAELNRNAFLEERRSKLAKKYLISRQLQNQRSKRASDQENNKRIQLSRLLDSAEAKRHLLMAIHVKNCALAVKRAKEVARLQHLRAEKEREHRRVELDLKISHSSQRRNRILRSISNKFTSPEFNPMTPLEAAVVIQKWWRQSKFTPLIKNFERFNLSIATVQKLDFPVIAVRLKSKPLLKAAATLLIRSRWVSSLYSTQSRYRNSVKVFMTAYLISVHPQEILGEVDGKILSPHLHESAKNMLSAFETWTKSLDGSMFYVNLHQFLVLWDEYYFEFEAWRSSDVRKLVENMTQHYVELDTVWSKVRSGVQEDDQAWRQEILRQREEIKNQVRNIGGEEAVRELVEKQRLARQANLEPLISPSISKVTMEPEIPSPPTDSVAPDIVLSEEPQSQVVYEKIQEAISKSQNLALDSTGTSPGISTRQLAHEIIMNPKFSLAPNVDPLTKQVREMATKAFFDTFREKIATNGADVMLVSLLEEVRDKIIQLLPPQGHFCSSFQSRFDMELIKQQISQKTFQPFEWIGYIGETLKAICAPVRDTEVSKVATFSDPVEAFKFTFEMLDIMLNDHLNHQITVVRPLLASQAVEFEAKHFNQLLDRNEISLNRTTAWLTTSVQDARSSILARNSLPLADKSSWPSYESLFGDALLTLLFSQQPVTLENCPETLNLDVPRLLEFQNELQRLAITSALVMICQNVAGDRLRTEPGIQSKLKDSLLNLLRNPNTTLNNLSEHLADFLASHTTDSDITELPSSQKEFLASMVRKTVSYRDSVYLVVARRLQRIVKQLILSTNDHAPPSPAALQSYGLGVVSSEILQLGANIKTLARFNRQVYASHYDRILATSLLAAMQS